MNVHLTARELGQYTGSGSRFAGLSHLLVSFRNELGPMYHVKKPLSGLPVWKDGGDKMREVLDSAVDTVGGFEPRFALVAHA